RSRRAPRSCWPFTGSAGSSRSGRCSVSASTDLAGSLGIFEYLDQPIDIEEKPDAIAVGQVGDVVFAASGSATSRLDARGYLVRGAGRDDDGARQTRRGSHGDGCSASAGLRPRPNRKLGSRAAAACQLERREDLIDEAVEALRETAV